MKLILKSKNKTQVKTCHTGQESAIWEFADMVNAYFPGDTGYLIKMHLFKIHLLCQPLSGVLRIQNLGNT